MNTEKTPSTFRILLVEDNEHDRLAFRRTFQKSDVPCEITDYACAEDALEQLRSNASSFHIVVIDYMSPGMSGLDLYRKMLHENIHLPAVILTGSGSEHVAVEALQAGIDDYIIKDPTHEYLNLLPIVLSRVAHKYDDHLKGKEAEQSLKDNEKKELRRSEEEYRSLLDDVLDSSRVGIFILDSNFKIVWVNRALEIYFGLRRDNIIGRDKRQLIHEQIKDKFEDSEGFVKKVLSSYDNNVYVENFECHVLPGSGRLERWLEHWSQPIWSGLYAGGRVEHYTDITKRKQAEEELRVKDNAIASSMNAIAFTDLEGNLTYVNSAFLTMWGYDSEKEVLGKAAVQFWQIQERAQEVVEALRHIGEWKGELTAMSKGGSNFDVELSAYMINDEGGRPSRMIASFVNITERKKAEEELRNSEERLRTIFEYAPDGLYLSDLKGNLIDGNKAAEEMTGYRKDELIGKSFLKLKLLPAGQIPKAAAILAKNVLGQSTKPEEFTLKRKDGAKIQVEISSHSTKIAGKAVVFGIARDITQRKKMEEEKKELEQKSQLASRLATVGEMASGVAHEINNPLTGVIGFSQLLAQREDIPEDTKQQLEIIAEGSQRVASIVSRLLAFARQHKPEQSYIDINELLENTLKLRAYEIRTSDIELSTRLDSALPRTMADGAQLQQVFLNIIINAETEMKEVHGKGKLVVKTEAIDDTIRISFKDNGPGISPENLDRLFDPFFTTREVGKGTGLGLSICHGIITEHNGKIYARSNSGKGATFVVELPVVAEVKQAEPGKPAIKEVKKVIVAKILVVDDEPTTLQLLTHLLSSEGYDVESTEDAATALEKIKSQRYNLILLDIKLPGMSGIELYESIQKVARSLASRVVFITGDAMAPDTMSFLSRTKAPHITKPFDIKKLKRTVRRILAQS